MGKINVRHAFNGLPPTQDVIYDKFDCDYDYGGEENQLIVKTNTLAGVFGLS